MTLEQATDIWLRLETVILGLEAALPLAVDADEATAYDIDKALQFARAALAVCKKEVLR